MPSKCQPVVQEAQRGKSTNNHVLSSEWCLSHDKSISFAVEVDEALKAITHIKGNTDENNEGQIYKSSSSRCFRAALKEDSSENTICMSLLVCHTKLKLYSICKFGVISKHVLS